MEITGRLTADARVNTLTDNREVTNFTLVMNDRFTTKSGEKREVATFIKCAYWVSSKIAEHLKKGGIVTVYGRIGMDMYTDTAGQPQGSLSFHVNDIKLVASAPRSKTDSAAVTIIESKPSPETVDDLPF